MTVNGNSQPKQSKKAEKLCAGCLVLLILVSFLAAGCRSKDNIEFADAQAMADELAQEGYIPDDWVYIDYWYPGHFNFGRIVLVYIDQDLYESHKSYWLEGVEPESLYPGYEPEEPENVFHLVNITAQTDGSREAAVYMTGTYYKYVNRLEANYHKPGRSISLIQDWHSATQILSPGSASERSCSAGIRRNCCADPTGIVLSAKKP